MGRRGYWKELSRDVWRAVYILLGSFIVAFIYNQVRSEGIPVVAREDYQIFVPCPETEEEAGKATLDDLSAGEELAFPAGTVLVDARSEEAFAQGHIAGAVNVPYDELMGVDEGDVERLKKLAGSHAVVVYCDGWEEEENLDARYDHPPSEHLADELKSQGLENVSSLTGGLREYRSRGGEMTR